MFPTLVTLLALAVPAPAADDVLVAAPVDAAARISAVTVYPGRAAITRSATVPVTTGLHAVRFAGLPDALQSDSLQARVAGGTAKVLGIDYVERPVLTAADPALAALDAKVEAAKLLVAQLGEDAALIAQQEKLVDAISIRAAGDATERAGTPQLSIEALKAQIDFVATQRTGLLKLRRDLTTRTDAARKALAQLEAERAARAGQGRVAREAVVTIAATGSGQAAVDLVYLVANAGWAPTYNVRGALNPGGGGTAAIEYDALIAQRSGEDWNDVTMTLSTAQPTVAANPPALTPVFVDVWTPPSTSKGFGSVSSAPAYRMAEAPPAEMADAAGSDINRGDDGRDRAKVDKAASAAEVVAGGPAVSYLLPRPVTVKTNADRQQRTRIAAIAAEPTFVHVAVPLLTDSVYLRGELANSSPYLLLPGPAAIFLGNDFIGPTQLALTPPNERIRVFFGIDRNLAARRIVVAKNTERTGLFNGGVRITSDFRIELDNPTGRPATLEVFDRIPVSRNEQVTVELTGPSAPLSTNAEYLRDERPQGILRWDVVVAAGTGGATAQTITFGTRVSHAKDVRPTGLPE